MVKPWPMRLEPTTCPFASFTYDPSALSLKATLSKSVVAMTYTTVMTMNTTIAMMAGTSWRRIT